MKIYSDQALILSGLILLSTLTLASAYIYFTTGIGWAIAYFVGTIFALVNLGDKVEVMEMEEEEEEDREE